MPLVFESSFDDSKFSAAMRRMEKDAVSTVGKIGGAFSGVGTLLTAGLSVGAIKNTFNFAGQLQDSADALSMNVEQMQGFSGAMAESGVSVEKFDKGMGKLTQNIQAARDGNKDIIESFKRLGVGLDDLKTDDTGEVVLKLADGLSKAGSSTTSFAAAMDLLGKGQQGMIASLKQGRDAFQEQADAVKKLSAQEVKDLDAAGDAWTRFGRSATVSTGGFLAKIQSAFGGAGFFANVAGALQGQGISSGAPSMVDEAAARAAADARKAQRRSGEGINQELGATGQTEKELSEIEKANEETSKRVREINKELQDTVANDQIKADAERMERIRRQGDAEIQAEIEKNQELARLQGQLNEINDRAFDQLARDAERTAAEEEAAAQRAAEAFSNFTRGNSNDRRQMVRDARAEDRAEEREKRFARTGIHDARFGASRFRTERDAAAEKAALAKEEAKRMRAVLDAEAVKALTDAIAALQLK